MSTTCLLPTALYIFFGLTYLKQPDRIFGADPICNGNPVYEKLSFGSASNNGACNDGHGPFIRQLFVKTFILLALGLWSADPYNGLRFCSAESKIFFRINNF